MLKKIIPPALLVLALGLDVGYSRPGRIPGSANAPAGSLLDPSTGCFLTPPQLRSRLEFLLDETDVVAQCGGGISATIVIFALALLGRNDIRLYDGS